MPAVSVSKNGTFRQSAGCWMTSRVVPAVALTIARRVPPIRLKSVDFPTFGRPTRTTAGSCLEAMYEVESPLSRYLDSVSGCFLIYLQPLQESLSMIKVDIV